VSRTPTVSSSAVVVTGVPPMPLTAEYVAWRWQSACVLT
jgi:hypothetical protein